jgi:hypothetical protein
VLRIAKLRAHGLDRTYDVDFRLRSPSLAVIAGQIHTGKTTILELVDYCLGADDYPAHPEVSSRVRAVSLEIELAGSAWTIERPLFSGQAEAWIHPGPLDDAGAERTRLAVDAPGKPGTLSGWLTEQLGLGDLKLSTSRRNPNAQAQTLSFRDLFWICFLPSERLDNKALLFEGADVKRYKLEQVIELVFDVYDAELAGQIDRLARLRDELREKSREIEALATFLAEDGVPNRAELVRHREILERERASVARETTDLEAGVRDATDEAQDLRARFETARHATRDAATRLRDRRDLRERLLPLRAQYAEDERKLAFIGEARRLLDPVHIDTCPRCLQRLTPDPDLPDGACSLCHQPLDAAVALAVDPERERRELQRRRRDLDPFLTQVEHEIARAERELATAAESEQRIGAELESRVASVLGPRRAARDRQIASRSEINAQITAIERALGWREALDRRRGERDQVEETIRNTRDAIEKRRGARVDKADLHRRLSERFASLLRDWGFPKVEDEGGPFLDDRFVPHVRGRAYSRIGSQGAMTLCAVAWQLTLFEEAELSGARHPRVVIIDNPQKNLTPAKPGDPRDEYMDAGIVHHMWRHLTSWAANHPETQLIVVENNPPAEADPYVIVRYSRDTRQPPYGFIDDAV